MKIAIISANGRIGQRLSHEALNRGHHVTAVVRNPSTFSIQHANLKTVQADATSIKGLTAAMQGQEVVISAIGPPHDGSAPASMLSSVAPNLIEAAKRSGARLMIVGGAGSLKTKEGIDLVDTPTFPEAYKETALAHRDALEIYKKANINWGYLSPAAMIAPGERTGRYRTGNDRLLTNDKGESFISMEDYAVAMLDEIEKPKFIKKRFTAAY